MTTIILVGDATTTTTKWLHKYFSGEATLNEFATHFHNNYRSSKGTVIPKKNVYSRIRKDELRGVIKKRKLS